MLIIRYRPRPLWPFAVAWLMGALAMAGAGWYHIHTRYVVIPVNDLPGYKFTREYNGVSWVFQVRVRGRAQEEK